MLLLSSFLAAGIALGTPILLAALGELAVERTGVLNIGIEGVILCGAFAAALAASASGSAGLGCVAAAAVGSLVALVFAWATVLLGADQIIVGTAVNLLALGTTGALYRALFGTTGAALVLPTLPALAIPGLGELPFVGAVLFRQHALVYVALAATLLLAWILGHTGIGLRLRALGDQPLAAASLGIPVRGLRVATLAAAGALGGLAGASLSLAAASTFVEGISAGRGFIALAVVVFGRWSAFGVLVGSLLFGLANALQFQFQAAALGIAYQWFLMLPYVLTLGVLAVSRGTVRAPRGLGTHYERG